MGNATNQTSLIPTTTLTNTSTYSGQTSYGNFTYQTDVKYVSGLLANSSDGVNHFATVAVNGANAIDGLVAVMQVKIVERPSTRASYVLCLASSPSVCSSSDFFSTASSSQLTFYPSPTWMLVALVALISFSL